MYSRVGRFTPSSKHHRNTHGWRAYRKVSILALIVTASVYRPLMFWVLLGVLRTEHAGLSVVFAISPPQVLCDPLIYGAQQSGIQSVINAELTLAKWDGRTPINEHRDHMKTLCTRSNDAGLCQLVAC